MIAPVFPSFIVGGSIPVGGGIFFPQEIAHPSAHIIVVGGKGVVEHRIHPIIGNVADSCVIELDIHRTENGG